MLLLVDKTIYYVLLFDAFEEMELCPRISCWTARVALLVTFVVLLMHHDNQQNVANASPLPISGFEDYSEGGRHNISLPPEIMSLKIT